MNEEAFEHILQQQYAGNSVLSYVIATSVFFGLWIALWALKTFGMMKLKTFLKTRHSRLEDFTTELTRSIHPAFLPIIALNVALTRLTLHGRVERILDGFILCCIVVQTTTILSRLVSFLILRGNMGGRAAENDLSLRSMKLNVKALASFAIWLTAILFFLSNLGIDITTFVTGLGIGGIAIALAAQSVLGDVFSSFTIALDKPFEIGDSIQIDQLRGTVEHIGLKTARIRSLNGEMVVLPNSDLTRAQIRNFTRTQQWRIQLQVGVIYESSVETLKAIPDWISQVISAEADTKFERAIIFNFGDSSINYDVVYFVNSYDERRVALIRHAVNVGIVEIFRKYNVQFAYPTRLIITQNG
jgi:small-conductance mechanosensitive channel